MSMLMINASEETIEHQHEKILPAKRRVGGKSENQSPATIDDYRRCLYSQCRDQSASKNNLQMHLYEFETHANLYPETMGTI